MNNMETNLQITEMSILKWEKMTIIILEVIKWWTKGYENLIYNLECLCYSKKFYNRSSQKMFMWGLASRGECDEN